MTDMERLCRAVGDAIAFQVGNRECFAPEEVDVCDDTQCWCKNTASYVVDQVLRELRDPSGAMLDAAEDAEGGAGDSPTVTTAYNLSRWRAMIDTILQEAE